MKLNDGQRAKVAEWIASGAKLAEIQKRLESEFGMRVTYMEVRFLVDDLKLTPKDPEPPKAADVPPGKSAIAGPGAPTTPAPASTAPTGVAPLAQDPAAPVAGGVSVKVDALARPGALVSGSATFSDGMKAEWFLDQTGRLGFVPAQQGYRPSPPDMQSFQAALEGELSKLGF